MRIPERYRFLIVSTTCVLGLTWVYCYFATKNKKDIARSFPSVVDRKEPIKHPEPGSGWVELPPSQSIYHDNGKSKPERKFIHRDGREAVYDGDKETLITDRRFMGTYNYVNPRTKQNPAWTWIWRGPGHFFADMLPYYIWGN